ncbi:MAG: serine hydrolase [Verrucomicrobiales bacterium]
MRRGATTFILTLAGLLLLGGCDERKAAMLEAKALELDEREDRIEERGENLSEWADELDAKELQLESLENEIEGRAEAVEESRADLEKFEEGLEKFEEGLEKNRLELEERYKGAIRGTVPGIGAKYAIVVDALTGLTLYEKDADKKVPVASTQKLLTALLTIESGKFDGTVEVTPADVRVEPTLIGIKPGSTYEVRELVKSLLVRSGNDVAQCLARVCEGSLDAFAAKMNERALSLGMESSNFINPHGLPATGQVSTARDMSKLAMAAYRNETIREFVSIPTSVFKHPDGSTRTLTNTNKVMRAFDACNGMKTGYTRASGYCLVSSGEKEGLERIVVVLGAFGGTIWSDSEKLLRWALKG